MELELIIGISAVAIVFAVWLASSVLKRDTREAISNVISIEAEGFLAYQKFGNFYDFNTIFYT